MSIVSMNGFDAVAENLGDIEYVTALGRYGGIALHRIQYTVSQYHQAAKASQLHPSATTVIISFAFRPGLSGSYARAGLHLAGYQSITMGPRMVLTPDGSGGLQLWYTTTPRTVASPSYSLPSLFADANTYYYIEYKVTFGASGSWEIRVNGTVVGSQTGVNTDTPLGEREVRLFGNDWFGYVAAPTTLLNMYVDDYIIITNLGTNNNNYKGDRRIYLLSATGGATAGGTWLRQPAGGSFVDVVDEQPHNSATDYLYLDPHTNAAYVIFASSDMPAGFNTTDIIPAVCLRYYHQEISHGGPGLGLNGLLRNFAGTDYELGNEGVSSYTSWLEYDVTLDGDVFDVGYNPLTVADLYDWRFGPKTETSASLDGYKVTGIYYEVISPNVTVASTLRSWAQIIGA